MSSTSFMRNRKLGFKDLIILLMNFSRAGLQTEIDRFFKSTSLSINSFESISKSAFSQSRQKLKHEAFIELYKSQLNHFDINAPHKKSWKSSRIIAIDSSVLNLPTSEELLNYFGFKTNQYETTKSISARCSFAYDVENDLIIDGQIAPVNTCEKEIAVHHLSALDPQKDILVFDRGYPALWLIALLIEKGFRFCFRLSSAWKAANALVESNQDDIEWICQSRNLANFEKEPYYKYNLDLKQRIPLRMVAIHLKEKTKEVLVTNLTDKEKYTLVDLKILYGKRWGIEEGYKIFKKVLQIESFTGRTVVSIHQDFYAKVLMFNTASMIRTQGIKHERGKSKHLLKTNKTQCIAKTKDFLIDLYYKENINNTIEQLISLVRKCYDIVRPERSFKRLPRGTRRRLRGLNYKGI